MSSGHNLPFIIGLNGPIGAGKDTVADFLAAHYGYHKIGFSDPVYESLWRLNPPVITGHHKMVHLRVLVEKYGWDFVKRTYPVVREWLRIIGTENGRDIHGEDCWVDVARLSCHRLAAPRYVFRDVRFPNEEEFIRAEGGVIWKLEGRTSEEVAKLPEHRSEKQLITADEVLINDKTIQALCRQVNETLSKYLEG